MIKLEKFIFNNFNFKKLKYKFLINFFKAVPRFFNFLIFYDDPENIVFSFYIKTYYLENFLFFLKNSSFILLKILNDLIVIDLFFNKVKFKFVYNLRSYKYNTLIFLNCFSDVNNLILPSITSLFKSAGWLERESYDMFGVQFLNNFDLRRILTDYGFQGYPLRKDFPLMGFVEVFYDAASREIIYKSVPQSAQSFRFFNFHSNWEDLY